MKTVIADYKNLWLKIGANKTPSSVKIDNDFWKYFKPKDKILDVGCGWGRAVCECLKRGLYVVGIDINKNEITELKKKRLKGAEIRQGDIFKKAEIFDLIKNSGFKAVKFKRAEFTSYHGRKRPGMMIIAQKI